MSAHSCKLMYDLPVTGLRVLPVWPVGEAIKLERDLTYIDGTVTVCVGAVVRRTASTTEEAECHMIDLATGIW